LIADATAFHKRGDQNWHVRSGCGLGTRSGNRHDT
jgi:hypothetical protein